METPTGYHQKLIEITEDIINHGFGEIKFSVYSLNDEKVKIVINAGRSWVFFIQKDIDFRRDIL